MSPSLLPCPKEVQRQPCWDGWMDGQTQVTAALSSHIPVPAMPASLCQQWLLPARVITENYLFATGWQLGLPVSDTNIHFRGDECGCAAGTGHGGRL